VSRREAVFEPATDTAGQCLKPMKNDAIIARVVRSSKVTISFIFPELSHLALLPGQPEVDAMEADGERHYSTSAQESHSRSVLKAFTWRVLASLTTAAIILGLTGRLDTAALVGSIEIVLKLVIYYIHERIWQMFPANGGWRKVPSAVVNDAQVDIEG